MKITSIPISELKAMPYQPLVRTIDKHVLGLKKSISEVGLLVPILIDKHKNIIDGHRRVAAFKMLNLANISVLQYNGELSGKKPIDVYIDINTTQRKMNALEQLDVYLRGGKTVGGVGKAIQWAEENLGREYLTKLLKNSFSPFYVTRLKGIAFKCGYFSPVLLRRFYDWAMRHGQFAQLVAIEKIGADVRCVRKAVSQNKPLRRKISFN